MKFIEKLTKEQLKELELVAAGKNEDIPIQKAQAIILIENNATEILIKSVTGYLRSTAVKLRKKYIKKGLDALKNKRRKKASNDLLTRNQRDELDRTLRTKKPREFGYDSDYWTTNMIGHLIKEQYNVQYKSRTPIYLILRRAKFTYHKPEKVHEKHNPEAIEKWKKEMQPIINEASNELNTVVLAGDEMTLTTDVTTQKIWLPANEYPKILTKSKRERRHLYGFLNIENGVQNAFKTMDETGETTVSILKKLAKIYQGKKIVLIWDNASWHKSHPVREFLATTNQFKLYNFIPYSPEENPQEHVWKAGRQAITHNVFIKDIDKATDQLLSFFNDNLFKYSFFGLHSTASA